MAQGRPPQFPIRPVSPAIPSRVWATPAGGVTSPAIPAQTFTGAPGAKSPDSPNYRPSVGVIPPRLSTNPKTGIGTIARAQTVVAPRPSDRAGRPIQPPKKTTKGTPGRANAAPTPTKPAATSPAHTGTADPAPPNTTAPSKTADTSYAPLSAALMTKLAAQYAHLAINEQAAPYDTQIGQLNTQSAQHAQAISGFANALAELYKPIGGNVNDAYAQAADAIKSYAQGFSGANDQLKQDAGASASSANPNMTAAQQAEIAKGYAGTPYDVMYGIHGYDPATTMRMLGAGLKGVYSKMPEAAGAYGQEWLGSSQATALKALQALQSAQTQVHAQYPKLFRDELQQLQTMDRQNQSLDLTKRATLGNLTGVDPATGAPTLAAKKAAAAESAANVRAQSQIDRLNQQWNIHLDNATLADRRIMQQQQKFVRAQQEKKKFLGLTANQFYKNKSKAAGAARKAHQGWRDSDGTVNKPMSWQQFMTFGLTNGVPVQLLITEGRKVYSQKEIHEGLFPGSK